MHSIHLCSNCDSLLPRFISRVSLVEIQLRTSHTELYILFFSHRHVFLKVNIEVIGTRLEVHPMCRSYFLLHFRLIDQDITILVFYPYILFIRLLPPALVIPIAPTPDSIAITATKINTIHDYHIKYFIHL